MPAAPSLPTSLIPNVTTGHLADTLVVYGVIRDAYKVAIGTTRTGSFSVAASDSGETILSNSASPILVTFPVLTAGHVSKHIRQGAGTLSFANSGTTFLKASDLGLTARVQGSSVTATYLTSTLVLLEGDLT
jgi:hypothetical protein